ncbi:MAG: hypothetical protein E7439_04050 [Ruminococcaceae bacterium]|nr:hypothetical protein [Oscillospiraceae bacterium]
MTQMEFLLGMLFIWFVLIVGIVVSAVFLIVRLVRKTGWKAPLIALGIQLLLFGASALFCVSHSTYYRYNDWEILNNSVYEVQEKYGDFDLGKISEGHSGTVAYYIYKDDGPIMPDHLDHYYYMEYDENGIIYKVYDGCAPGG